MRFLCGTLACLISVGSGLCQPPDPDPLAKYKGDVAANRRSSLAHFRLGEAYLLQKNFQSAANELREALNGDLMPKWTEVWAHIDLGKIFDIVGQCERAVNEYNLALRTRYDAFGSQAEVQEYLSSNIIRPVVTVPIGKDDSGRQLGSKRMGNDAIIAPILLARTEPQYSEAARLAGLEGTVLLKATIAEDGSPTEIRVTRPLGLGLDEKAIQSVRNWLFTPGFSQGRPVSVVTDLAVDFFLPSKSSRWHLAGVTFHPLEGASEPVFVQVDYPTGAGISRKVIDDAGIVAATRRIAAVRLSFDVNEQGLPVHFQVENASAEFWGSEALAVVEKWTFKPGAKDGSPVSVPATIDLIWGERNLTSSPVEFLRALDRPNPSLSSGAACGTNRPIAIYNLDLTPGH